MDLETLKELFVEYDAYLVGGAARYYVALDLDEVDDLEDEIGSLDESTEPRDFDVIICNADKLPDLPYPYTLNSFKGRKYKDLHLDIWLDDIGEYLREVPRAKDGIAIHLETGAILHTREFIYGPRLITNRRVRTRKKS